MPVSRVEIVIVALSTRWTKVSVDFLPTVKRLVNG